MPVSNTICHGSSKESHWTEKRVSCMWLDAAQALASEKLSSPDGGSIEQDWQAANQSTYMSRVATDTNLTAAVAMQLKALSRITLKPLVDTLPCMGSVTISLIEDPHMDFSLHLFQQFDLMLLPGVRQAATYCINMVQHTLVPI